MKPRSAKNKGARFQKEVAEVLRALTNLPAEDIAPAIMGEKGMDIKLSSKARKLIPLAIECKNTERLSLYEAWKQCQDNATKENLNPVLFIKKNRHKPLVVIDMEFFLYLMFGGINEKRN